MTLSELAKHKKTVKILTLLSKSILDMKNNFSKSLNQIACWVPYFVNFGLSEHW